MSKIERIYIKNLSKKLDRAYKLWQKYDRENIQLIASTQSKLLNEINKNGFTKKAEGFLSILNSIRNRSAILCDKWCIIQDYYRIVWRNSF